MFRLEVIVLCGQTDFISIVNDVDASTREQIDTRGVCSFYGQVGINWLYATEADN